MNETVKKVKINTLNENFKEYCLRAKILSAKHKIVGNIIVRLFEMHEGGKTLEEIEIPILETHAKTKGLLPENQLEISPCLINFVIKDSDKWDIGVRKLFSSMIIGLNHEEFEKYFKNNNRLIAWRDFVGKNFKFILEKVQEFLTHLNS